MIDKYENPILSSSEKDSLIYQYIKQYKDGINYESFHYEYISYTEVFKEVIASLFNIWYYGNNINIDRHDTYITIRFAIVELTITDDKIKIKVCIDDEHINITDFKEIYQEVLQIESIVNENKNIILNYYKLYNIIYDNIDNIDNIDKCIFNHFYSVETNKKNDIERELKLKFIELL